MLIDSQDFLLASGADGCEKTSLNGLTFAFFLIGGR